MADSVGLTPQALPWSALLAQDAGIAVGSKRWLALEALSLKVSPNGIYVVASGDFGQTVDEMCTLWMASSTTLACAGLVLEPQVGLRAFAELPDDQPEPDTDPAEDLLGVELQAHMPVERRWRRWLGELQIEWTQHPLHTTRLERGALPINSPWFGRASRWQDAPQTIVDIYSRDPLVAAFGRWAGARGVPAPDARTALVDGRNEDAAALKWLQGAMLPAVLRFACGRRFLLRRTDRLRFWRRPLALPSDTPAVAAPP